MFKGPRGFFITIFGAIAIMVGIFVFGLKGSNADADTSRMFLTHVTAGETADAYALLHVSITERHSEADLADLLNGMEPFTTIAFPSLSFSTENGTRITELEGTGTTVAGCESTLDFHLLNGEITYFDIAPLCTGGASDT